MNRLVVCFGGPQVRDGDRVVHISGNAGRILAALVARRQGVTIDQLIEVVWPEGAPDSARAALHVHMGRLRKLLAEAAGVGEPQDRLVRAWCGTGRPTRSTRPAGTSTSTCSRICGSGRERSPASTRRGAVGAAVRGAAAGVGVGVRGRRGVGGAGGDPSAGAGEARRGRGVRRGADRRRADVGGRACRRRAGRGRAVP